MNFFFLLAAPGRSTIDYCSKEASEYLTDLWQRKTNLNSVYIQSKFKWWNDFSNFYGMIEKIVEDGMRTRRLKKKYNKHCLLSHTQPFIFLQTLLPFQRAYVIGSCFLKKKRTSNTISLSGTVRSFGSLSTEASVLLLFFFFNK